MTTPRDFQEGKVTSMLVIWMCHAGLQYFLRCLFPDRLCISNGLDDIM